MKLFLQRLKKASKVLFGKKTNPEKIEFRNNSIYINSPLEDNYLFDFTRNWHGGFSNSEDTSVPEDESSSESTKPTQKIKIKPIDVLDELETLPTPFSLNNLDDKLSVLRDKEELITQHYAKREVTALIERLENRKKYNKYKSFFDNFQNTTQEKIDNLLSKYELVMKESDIFIPEFPDDAIKVMKDYTEKVQEMTGKKPIFYVIAKEVLFKKAYEKRDPILLAQSPFGFYYQILGAWDKEMMLLCEL